MKKLIYRIILILVIAIGIYGVSSCGLFYKKCIFSVSDEYIENQYQMNIKPEMEKRLEKIDFKDLSETEKKNMTRIVKYMVVDKYIMTDLNNKFHVVVLSLIISFFAITLGLIGLLFTKKNDSIKK